MLEKSAALLRPGRRRKFDRLVFRIIPDDNVRLANLRSGDIDFMHLVGPTDAASLRKEGKFEVVERDGHRLHGVHHQPAQQDGQAPSRPGNLGTPLANDPRVREALELSIDREALNQVAWDGQYTPGCTPISPVSPFYDKSRKCPTRDVAQGEEAPGRRGPRRRVQLRDDDRQRSAAAAGGRGDPGDGQGGRLQHQPPALPSSPPR